MNNRFYGVYNYIEINDEDYEINNLLAEDCSCADVNKVKALAYLGAAFLLNANNKLPHGKIPECLPENLRNIIDDCIVDNYGFGEK